MFSVVDPELEMKRDRNREYMRAYRAANPEKVKEAHRKYYAANPEKARERSRKYRAKNHDKVIERLREKRAANPEKNREAVRKYRAKHPEEYREYMREYYAANSEKLRETVRASQAKHPETRRASRQRRRASIKTSVMNAPTAKQIATLILEQCIYCGDPSEHIDHIIPLARGGTHDIDNLAPACAPCNLSKGAKMPGIEWHGRGGNGNISRLDASQ